MSISVEQFWEWFNWNKERYEHLNDIKNQNRKNELLNEFTQMLHKYSSGVFFQISHEINGIKELIITAEGNVEHFDDVENLVSNAPNLQGWNIISFIPPASDPSFEINYEGVYLSTEEIWFHPLEDENNPSSIGIKVLVKDYSILKDNSWTEAAIDKVLELLLGELSFVYDLNYIEFDELPENPEEVEGLIIIKELADYLSWHKRNYKM